MTDLSEGGLGFCAISPPETPTFPVSIRLWSSAGFKLIAAIVEVAWADTTSKTGGLRFTYLPDESREQIRKWHFELSMRSATEQQPRSHPVWAYGYRQPIMPSRTKVLGRERNLGLLMVTAASILAGVIGFTSNSWHRDNQQRVDWISRIQGDQTVGVSTRELAPNSIPAVASAQGNALKPVLLGSAPAQTGNGDEFLLVQVGSFVRKQSEAQNFVEKLRRNNFVAYASQLGNSEFYRVQLGPYTTDEAADTAQGELQKAGFESFVREAPILPKP